MEKNGKTFNSIILLMENYLGKLFVYENQVWRAIRYIGIDMFVLKSEENGEIIRIPITWAKLCN